MSSLITPIKSGFQKSLRVLWFLTRIIIPVTLLLHLLEYYDLLEPAAAFCAPVTSWLGLPGEAVLPLMLGFWTNFYASLGVIANMSLSARQITVFALILGICHELPIESAICSSTGLKIYQSILLRLATAFLAGFLLNAFYTMIGG
ncbi:MAG: nucleoside recognition protein [Firmicutes bacterium]|nr:nucleoside recognition protein [Bacillota bacterium]